MNRGVKMRKILRGEKICKSFNDDNENRLVLKNVDLEHGKIIVNLIEGL